MCRRVWRTWSSARSTGTSGPRRAGVASLPCPRPLGTAELANSPVVVARRENRRPPERDLRFFARNTSRPAPGPAGGRSDSAGEEAADHVEVEQAAEAAAEQAAAGHAAEETAAGYAVDHARHAAHQTAGGNVVVDHADHFVVQRPFGDGAGDVVGDAGDVAAGQAGDQAAAAHVVDQAADDGQAVASEQWQVAEQTAPAPVHRQNRHQAAPAAAEERQAAEQAAATAAAGQPAEQAPTPRHG